MGYGLRASCLSPQHPVGFFPGVSRPRSPAVLCPRCLLCRCRLPSIRAQNSCCQQPADAAATRGRARPMSPSSPRSPPLLAPVLGVLEAREKGNRATGGRGRTQGRGCARCCRHRLSHWRGWGTLGSCWRQVPFCSTPLLLHFHFDFRSHCHSTFTPLLLPLYFQSHFHSHFHFHFHFHSRSHLFSNSISPPTPTTP